MADQTTKKRGRPRKIAVDEDKKILTDNASETLMMEQKSAAGTNGRVTINQVAESLFSLYGSVLGTYNGKWGGNNINLYNPFLQNSRLKMINASPVTETPEEISQALKDPGSHEEELKSVSAGLSARQYLYYKILREACDVPMYKSYFLPETLEDASEYTSKKFRDEEAVFYCVGHSVVHYYLDDYVMANLEGHKGDKVTIELIGAFLPEVVVEGLYAVTDKTGLKVKSMTLEPIAAMNVIIPPEIIGVTSPI